MSWTCFAACTQASFVGARDAALKCFRRGMVVWWGMVEWSAFKFVLAVLWLSRVPYLAMSPGVLSSASENSFESTMVSSRLEQHIRHACGVVCVSAVACES